MQRRPNANTKRYQTLPNNSRLFGEDRCFFGSNYPVDFGLPDNFRSWVPEKLYPALLRLAVYAGVSEGGIAKLFAGNARRAYRAV